MKNILFANAAMLLVITAAYAQAPYKIVTRPKLPPRDVLERMNLTLAWNARVDVDGNRDGLASVQVIPGKPSQIVVQTFRGGVSLYDADNGDLIWKTTVGVPYWTPVPAGFNSHSIFVTRRSTLHVINRSDGAQRVFRYDTASRSLKFGHELGFTPLATLVADEEFVYVPMGDRLHAIYVPDFPAIDKAKKALAARSEAAKNGKKEAKDVKLVPELALDEGPDSPQTEFYWGTKLAGQIMAGPPLIYGDQLGIAATDGTLTSLSRYDRGPRIENFVFKTQGRTPSPAGQHLHMAYLASDDFNLYAVSMKNTGIPGRPPVPDWRHVSGAPITHQPYVNDRDVYIAPERLGLRRIDRASGREVWTNRDATRFLAMNLNYVYAMDRIGKFFVLDAQRGTTLAKHDLSDWTVHVPNEWTDRIFLAAHDGQVICLRHRELTKSLHLKALEPPAIKIKDKKPPMEEKKKEEEKEEKVGLGDFRMQNAECRMQAILTCERPERLPERRTWELR